MLTMAQALEALLAGARPITETETVDTLQANGRVLATPVTSALRVPPADNTSMDGYAMRAADVPAPGTRLPVSQRIPAGHVGTELAPGTAARIFTGGLIPPGADAVVMQEQCQADGDAVIVNHVPASGEWIRRAGEDIEAGSQILPAGARLSPQALGLAASVGQARLDVIRRVRVAVFFTGDELAMPGEPLKPGAIYNSNRFTLRGLLENLGCEVSDFGIVPDTLAATRDTLRRAAAGHDLIITSGGVSVGDADYTKQIMDKLGEVTFWKIAMRPGRPMAFGRISSNGHDAVLFGLPGNPVAVMVTFYHFVRGALHRLMGADVAPLPHIRVRTTTPIRKKPGRTEFQRGIVAAGPDGDLQVRLTGEQGSGVLRSMSEANCFVVLDHDQGPVAAGDTVQIVLFDGLI